MNASFSAYPSTIIAWLCGFFSAFPGPFGYDSTLSLLHMYVPLDLASYCSGIPYFAAKRLLGSPHTGNHIFAMGV
ncbi:MAG: hypothetical protein J3R72DRAFT_181291 [Linnemannia gamsii]|nr:MAG: hypothetical protein J3R72DRAFT_181291 [Linnemannia gamsii]